MTTAATSFVFSNASTRTRSSFGRSASASQMVDRLFSAALHRGSAQRSPDGAVGRHNRQPILGSIERAADTTWRCKGQRVGKMPCALSCSWPRRSSRREGGIIYVHPRPSHKPKVGTNSDQDKHHNCCGGGGECGWHWCSSSKSCKRFGECSKDDKPLVGGDVDKHGCKGSAGEYWNGSECANVRGD